MTGYVRKMCERFTADTGAALARSSDTPYISNEAWNVSATAEESPGVYTKIAPSHAATSLLLYRVGRPDLEAATQRLCAKVGAWTTVHDKALVKLMLYASQTASLTLSGTLAPGDLSDIELKVVRTLT